MVVLYGEKKLTMFNFKSTFFKLPSNNRFLYRPRHFDPEKEELEKRVKMIHAYKKRRELEGISFREEWSNSYADQWRNHPSNNRTAEFQRFFKIVFFIGFLSLVAYILYRF